MVLLGWHPEPQIYGVNFEETGLCHVSLDMDKAKSEYESWMSENLSVLDKDKYLAFLKQFNYPFDGKASERILNDISNV